MSSDAEYAIKNGFDPFIAPDGGEWDTPSGLNPLYEKGTKYNALSHREILNHGLFRGLYNTETIDCDSDYDFISRVHLTNNIMKHEFDSSLRQEDFEFHDFADALKYSKENAPSRIYIKDGLYLVEKK